MLGVSNPRTFDWSNIPLSEGLVGNAMDAFFTLKLFEKFKTTLSESNVDILLSNVINPATEILARSEYDGMDVDTLALRSLEDEINNRLDDTNKKLYSFDCVKGKNLGSNKDMISILYTGEDGFRLYPPDKTSKGSPSVSASTIELLLSIINTELERR